MSNYLYDCDLTNAGKSVLCHIQQISQDTQDTDVSHANSEGMPPATPRLGRLDQTARRACQSLGIPLDSSQFAVDVLLDFMYARSEEPSRTIPVEGGRPTAPRGLGGQ